MKKRKIQVLPKENDIIRFRKYGDIYTGRVLLLGESMGEEYYVVAAEDKTHVITDNHIIEITNEDSNK